MRERPARRRVGGGLDPQRPAIVVEGVSECFRLYRERPHGLRDRLVRWRRSTFTELDALRDVSFSVGHGESVAVIGENGSGKSTLLKLLARILPPDTGRVEVNGRVASLLELGAGFHGDLTGRENIYLNGAILGLTRAEIDARFDEIVEFAGIRHLLDTAVRTYSSGLYVRLGFAIAVTVDPDVLLVDEVLAVGDAEFQQRSLRRMQEFRDAGKTFILVSHDLDAVRQMCDRVLVLDGGRLVFDGPVAEGVEQYRRRVAESVAPPVTAPGTDRRVEILSTELVAADGEVAGDVPPSSALRLRVRLRARYDVEVCSIGAMVYRGDGGHLYEVHTAWHGLGVGPLAAGEEAVVEVRFVAHLLAGRYGVSVSVTDVSGREAWAVRPDAARFAVAPAPGGAGVVDLAATTVVTEGPARQLLDATTSGSIPVVRLERRRERG